MQEPLVITSSIIIMLRQSVSQVQVELDLSLQECVTVYNVSMVCAVDFHGMFISISKYVSNFLMLKIIVTIKDQIEPLILKFQLQYKIM
jgi:hypothetical protein